MPYPVPPPEPPAIVQHLPPEKIANADRVFVSAITPSGHLGETEEAIALDRKNTAALEKTDPPPLPGSTEKSAALLGETIGLSTVEESEAPTWQLETIFPPSPPSVEIASMDNWRVEKVFSQTPVLVGQASPTAGLEIVPEAHIAPTDPPTPPTAEASPPSPNTEGPALVGVIEVSSDSQEFDTLRQIFSAEGNVLLRYQGGALDADRVQGNLVTRTTVAEGNVAFRRGGQLFRGERLVYNFVQDTGNLEKVRGEIFVPTSGTDLTFDFPTTGVAAPIIADRPLSDRLLEDQPIQQVTGAGGITYGVGGGRANANLPAVRSGLVGQVNRVRLEAENVEFYPRGWVATNARLTNDPFSPPELEIRSDRAVLTRETPLRDVLDMKRPRLVFDQKVAIPLLRSRYVFDRSDREPPIVRFGYDSEERGGLFVEAPVDAYRSENLRVRLIPQFFLERAITQGFDNPSELFGLRGRLSATLTPRTTVSASVTIRNFDLFEDAEEKVRASLRAQQIIGTRYPHRLNLEYSFRDRLYNGSLGYQTVQQSFGALLSSPFFTLGKTGVVLFYQMGAQYINADTDRLDLLPEIRDNSRINLGRFQASATVLRGFYLWKGKPLPATPTQGLRYTPYPVVPNVQIIPILTGTTSLYSSGDTQNSLTASIGLQGQFGHFSRPFLDYTGFNIRLTRVFLDGLSPFFFDRIVDNRTLSFGITQQVYGPVRIGFQSSINLDTNESISTDYFVEYSRRTYGVILRYNPDLQLGAVVLRVSDFNWNAGTDPFGGSGVRFVDTGVIRETD